MYVCILRMNEYLLVGNVLINWMYFSKIYDKTKTEEKNYIKERTKHSLHV